MLRAARSAAGATLTHLGGLPRVSARGLRRSLQAPTGRGRCDSTLIAAFDKLPAAARAAAAAMGAPPVVVRRACADPTLRVAYILELAGAGAASWTLRGGAHDAPTRQCFARATRERSIPPDGFDTSSEVPAAILGRCIAPGHLVPATRTNWAAAAAANPATPRWALAAYTDDRRDQMTVTEREAAAANPSIPSTALRRMSTSDEHYTRWAAAASLGCDPALVAALTGDDEIMVALAAFRNPNCPTELLRRSERADTAVLSNVNCPPEVLDDGATDDRSWVRALTAENPSCAPQTVRNLALDVEPRVRANAAAHAACPDSAAASFTFDRSPQVRRNYAQSRRCPPEMLAALAQDDDDEVVLAAAQNPNCPAGALSMLGAPVAVSQLSLAVAANPATGSEHLEKLSRLDVRDVDEAIAGHPHTPEHLLFTLLAHHDATVAAVAVKSLNSRSRLRLDTA